MLKHVLFIFCMCLISIGANAMPNCPTADGTTQTDCEQITGCVWTIASGCAACTENNYYDSSSKTCKSCPSGYPNSAVGSVNGISDCYKPCETETITGGKRVPSSDKAYHNTQCTYTTQCDNDGGDCDLGFHPNGDNCVSNVTSCDNNGFKFYNGTGFSDCFVSSSSCGSGEQLVGRGHTCNNIPYGVCKTSAFSCSTAPGLNTSACNGGTISGDATLNGETYNLSQCTCEKESVPVSNGNAGEKCFYNASSNIFNIDCVQTALNSCNDGYCSTDGRNCIPIPENYYKNGARDCVQCPNGSYRSGSETTCTWDSRTEFSDSIGRFTIPASGKIIAK